MTETQTTDEFKKWCSDLDLYALKCGYEKNLTSVTGDECWICYFEDGLSPEEAFTEDLSYG